MARKKQSAYQAEREARRRAEQEAYQALPLTGRIEHNWLDGWATAAEELIEELRPERT